MELLQCCINPSICCNNMLNQTTQDLMHDNNSPRTCLSFQSHTIAIGLHVNNNSSIDVEFYIITFQIKFSAFPINVSGIGIWFLFVITRFDLIVRMRHMFLSFPTFIWINDSCKSQTINLRVIWIAHMPIRKYQENYWSYSQMPIKTPVLNWWLVAYVIE